MMLPEYNKDNSTVPANSRGIAILVARGTGAAAILYATQSVAT